MHELPDALGPLGDCGDTHPNLANPSGARCSHVPDMMSDRDHGIDDTQLECGGGVGYPNIGVPCPITVDQNASTSQLQGSGAVEAEQPAPDQKPDKTGARCVNASANASNDTGPIRSRKTRTGRHPPDRCLPGQEFQQDVTLLEERLLKEGADPDTVNILRTIIFHKGVTKDALKTRLTRAQFYRLYPGQMARTVIAACSVLPQTGQSTRARRTL